MGGFHRSRLSGAQLSLFFLILKNSKLTRPGLIKCHYADKQSWRLDDVGKESGREQAV